MALLGAFGEACPTDRQDVLLDEQVDVVGAEALPVGAVAPTCRTAPTVVDLCGVGRAMASPHQRWTAACGTRAQGGIRHYLATLQGVDHVALPISEIRHVYVPRRICLSQAL